MTDLEQAYSLARSYLSGHWVNQRCHELAQSFLWHAGRDLNLAITPADAGRLAENLCETLANNLAYFIERRGKELRGEPGMTSKL